MVSPQTEVRALGLVPTLPLSLHASAWASEPWLVRLGGQLVVTASTKGGVL